MTAPLVSATWVVVMAALVGPAPAPGSEQPDDPRDSGLEEQVRVEAAADVTADAAAFSTRIEGRELTRRGDDLADVLRRVPGVRIKDYGGLGSYATVSIRASTPDQVTVLVDGVPQNRALGGPVDLSSIPVAQIDSITVYRGFAPAGLGLGGIGGVVDVRTRRPGRDPEAQVDALAGELDTQRLSSSLTLRHGSYGVRISAEALRSDGNFDFLDAGGTPYDATDDVLRVRANNDLEQDTVLINQDWEDAGGGRLGLGLRVQRRQRGVPGVDSFQSTSARLDEVLEDLTATWSWTGEGSIDGLDLRADGFRQVIDFSDSGGIGWGSQDRTTRLGGFGVAGTARFSPGRHGLLVRAEWRREEAAARDRVLRLADRGGVDRDHLAVTAEDVIPLGPLLLAPSIRWESWRDDFDPGEPGALSPLVADVRRTRWTGKIGAACGLGPGLTLRGSIGSFQRTPNLLELFGDRGALIGNPALRPETGEAVELGLAYVRRASVSRLNLELVGFARDTEDLIWLDQTSTATLKPRNIADSRVHGLEVSVAWHTSPGIGVDAGLTLQRATDRSLFDGRPLMYQPSTLGHLAAGYGRGGFEAEWEVSHTGENSTTPLNEPAFRIPSRWIHDLALSYRWDGGLTLGLDVKNLLDRRVLDVARYPLPSRVAFVHLGWTTGEGRR